MSTLSSNKNTNSIISNPSVIADGSEDRFTYEEGPSSSFLRKSIQLLFFGLFIVVLFTIIYESTQSMFLAYNAPNGKTAPNPAEVDQYISSHPEVSVGLWKQCSANTGCIDMQLYCTFDEAKQSLTAAGLLFSATEDQKQEMVNNEIELCPLFTAARTTSMISIFLTLFTAGALFAALETDESLWLYIATLSMFVLTILIAATLGELVGIYKILTSLGKLGAQYSSSGSNTGNPYVDTVYAYSFGFWLQMTTFLICLLMLFYCVYMCYIFQPDYDSSGNPKLPNIPYREEDEIYPDEQKPIGKMKQPMYEIYESYEGQRVSQFQYVQNNTISDVKRYSTDYSAMKISSDLTSSDEMHKVSKSDSQ